MHGTRRVESRRCRAPTHSPRRSRARGNGGLASWRAPRPRWWLAGAEGAGCRRQTSGFLSSSDGRRFPHNTARDVGLTKRQRRSVSCAYRPRLDAIRRRGRRAIECEVARMIREISQEPLSGPGGLGMTFPPLNSPFHPHSCHSSLNSLSLRHSPAPHLSLQNLINMASTVGKTITCKAAVAWEAGESSCSAGSHLLRSLWTRQERTSADGRQAPLHRGR
jgi:hypothetical protein